MGSYLPPEVRSNDYWEGRLQRRDEAQRRGDILAIERTALGGESALPRPVAEAMAALGDDDLFRGARRRHVLADDAEAADMEVEAVRRALEDAHVSPDEVDLLLVHSLLPDRLNPSDGPAIVARWGLSRAVAWSLDVGCASFQPQLVAAAALLRAGVYRRVVQVCSTASSRFLDYSTPASTGFGDGAAASVLGPLPPGYGLLGHWQRTDGSLREGVALAPVRDGAPQRRWDKCAGPVRLATFDPAVGKLAGVQGAAFCREACLGALEDAGLALGDVSLYVGAQSVGWFVDACRRALELPRERAVDTFAEVGNISAAVNVYNLQRARADGRLRDGDVVLSYSPGAGLTRAAVVYRWHEPHSQARGP
jgi:3-oxoacyl-[acyl-carrier-protein] synthase-3